MKKEKITIKQGGCYKIKEGGWLIVGVKKNGYYQCRDIIVDDLGSDEEIKDLDDAQIREIADLSICFRPYYHEKHGLYAVWDETKPHKEKKILRQLTN